MMTCRRCNVEMRPGKALVQTLTAGAPDFPGDTHGSTMSADGPGRMVDCWKCPKCGYSVTKRDIRR